MNQGQHILQIGERANRMHKLRDIKIAKQENILAIARAVYANAVKTGGDVVTAYSTLLQLENELALN